MIRVDGLNADLQGGSFHGTRQSIFPSQLHFGGLLLSLLCRSSDTQGRLMIIQNEDFQPEAELRESEPSINVSLGSLRLLANQHKLIFGLCLEAVTYIIGLPDNISETRYVLCWILQYSIDFARPASRFTQPVSQYPRLVEL